MNLTKIQVAVVDDDESYARALGRLLHAAGMEAILYQSAEAFLAPSGVPAPDCLLVDIQLGGMSGFELQVRLAAAGSKLPIIFITAHDEPEGRETAQKAGCAAYLRKPFSRELLLAAIHKAVPNA